jgi:hypothetical protein
MFPREFLPAAQEWVMFELPGGAYTHEGMTQAAIDRIQGKIDDYENRSLRGTNSIR